jgi:ABC-type molybdate transport system substrate-binding protein
MKTLMKRIAVLAAMAAVVPVARADELKVLSAGTMHFSLKDVGDNFTRKTGTKLAITFGGAGGVKTKIEKDEPADVVPPELQDPEHSTWTAGVATRSVDVGRAKDFIRVLASPESLRVYKAKGYTAPSA